MLTVDLNADLGESFGNYRLEQNDALLDIVTSANIACGFHAGDPMIMAETVKKAAERGIGVGCHAGFPDLQGFGRRKMDMNPSEIHNTVLYQLGALEGFARANHVKIQHFNGHGALGTWAQHDMDVARAVARAVYEFDPSIIIPVQNAKACLNIAAQELGIRTVTRRFFTDRAYTDDGFLAPRSMPGSMITDEDFAIERAIRVIKEQKLLTITGKEIHFDIPQIIMLHGDQPKAVIFAQKLKAALEMEGIGIQNFAETMD